MMNPITLLEKAAHRAVAAKTLALLAALFGVWALPSQAGQSSAPFSVTINLNGGGPGPGGTPNTALCRSSSGIGAFGATLTVVCSNGAIVSFPGNTSNLPWTTTQDSSYRYMLNVYSAGQPLGVVDIYTGVGTVTSWRMIKLDHQDYLEMMVHW